MTLENRLSHIKKCCFHDLAHEDVDFYKLLAEAAVYVRARPQSSQHRHSKGFQQPASDAGSSDSLALLLTQLQPSMALSGQSVY